MKNGPRSFDLVLLVAAVALCGIGVALVYSASRASVPEVTPLWESPAVRQALYVVVGILVLLVVATIDYRLYGITAPALYVLMLASLGLVLLLGESTYGATRRFLLPFLPLQPSEPAKLLFILVLGKFLADREEKARQLQVLLLALLLAVPPLALIYLQPNLGTVVIFAGVWLGMVMMAGARLTQLAALGATGLALLPLGYSTLFQDYMRQRLAVFFNPTSDPLGMGYNILQAEISVGSGGLWGKGFLQGTQSQLHFLRIQRTDFVFSVLAEELGFVGAMVLLVLFGVLLLRCVRAASLARDSYGRLVAVGVTTMILIQVFINIAANTRLLPVTGITLPLISYGGNSLLTLLFALGILESIVLRYRRITF